MTSNDKKFYRFRRNAFFAQLVIILTLVFFLALVSDEAFAKSKVIVAVIDTGVDVNHKNLKDSIWRNHGEMGFDSQGRDRRLNGIDDDENGFVDDYQGWNFISKNNDVQDHHGHGSHVSGLILGSTENRETESQDIVIMPLKYYDSKIETEDTIPNTVKSIQYAIRMGADVINYSGGGYQSSTAEKKAIQEARDKGILFIAASGNDNQNVDQKPFYPAAYGLENIISVGSANYEKPMDFFSNYGIHNVNILAPGLKLKSTMPHSEFGILSGTSQAAAMVSHVIAELLSQQDFAKEKKLAKVKERIFKTQPPSATIRKLASEAVYLNEERTLSQRSEYEDAHDTDTDVEGVEDSLYLSENILLKSFKDFGPASKDELQRPGW